MTTTKSLTITGFTLLPANPNKDTRYRVGMFADWLNKQGLPLHSPDLAAYRDHLLNHGGRTGIPLSPSTICKHLSTIRAQFRRLMRDNATRDLLFEIAGQQTDNPLERKAIVDEIITQLENAINPDNSPVKVIKQQDIPDAQHLRLTKKQAEALLVAPGVDMVQGLRDTAIIAIMVCTGIREGELSALEVKDLRQELGGELALHIREGKGAKERLIPYGDLDWCLVVVDKWLEVAGIISGPVFRGLYKGGKTLRPGRLSLRAIEYITTTYPIAKNGEMAIVRPHDLRRTYARRLYEAGTDPVAIQQNLGHKSLNTTLGYIGTLDVDKRRPPAVYYFDLGALKNAPIIQLKIGE
jgi:site-specific recombinase XerD